jgi:hypothetical protein
MKQFNLMAITEIRKCLFCGTEKDLKNREHIIPESLGNKRFIIKNRVCKRCNNSFSDVESYFCQHHFGSLEKLNYLKQTKKGRKPSVLLMNGIATRDKRDNVLIKQVFKDKDEALKLIFAKHIEFELPIITFPVDTKKLSRFLAKCGIEILYYKKGQFAYSDGFDFIREYVLKNGKDIFIPFLWGENHEDRIDIQFVQLDSKLKGMFRFSRVIFPRCEYWFPLDRVDESYAFKTIEYNFKLQIVGKAGTVMQKPILKLKV